MYGNSPIDGMNPDKVRPLELTAEHRGTVRGSMKRIRDSAAALLPSDYEVVTDVARSEDLSRYAVAVLPPAGNPVTIEITPRSMAEQTDDGLKVDITELDFDDNECREAAHQLVASAFIQVQQAMEQADHDHDVPAS